MTQVHLLIGTEKGAFIATSDQARESWEVSGPLLGGWEVTTLHPLPGPNGLRIMAGTTHFSYGATIRYSDDHGETWTELPASPRYEAGDDASVRRIWQLSGGQPDHGERLYAGVADAGLFHSDDQGESWHEVTGLNQHPTRPGWFPGNGGLCLHTILHHPTDAQRMWVGISAVGVFRSDDGGATWAVKNDGLPEVATGMEYPEIGRCVHRVVLDPADPDTLYLQFHGGVFRSTDAGDRWEAIESGLPANFGFPIVVTKAGDLFVVPLVSDAQRYMVDGRLRVYRSRDKGASWHDSSTGLPNQPEFTGILRDAMTTDGLDVEGVYFGTSMGQVYASPDAGERWIELPGQFPRISSLRTWVEG